MEFYRFDAAAAQPLEGGTNAVYVPVRVAGNLRAMLVMLDRRGDTGKREAPADMLINVVSGEGRCRSGGLIADLRAGDVAVIPAGALNQIWTTDTSMQLVLLSL